MSKLYLQHDYAVTGRDYVDTEGGDTPAGGISYSTEEQDTGLTWVDGKKIYQKTIYIETATLVNSTPYVSAALDIAFDKVFSSELVADQGTTRIYSQVSYWNNVSISTARITNDNKIQLSTSSSSSVTWTDIYVTIRYTKTE